MKILNVKISCTYLSYPIINIQYLREKNINNLVGKKEQK